VLNRKKKFQELTLILMLLLLFRGRGVSQESRPKDVKWDLSTFFSAGTGEELSNSFGEAQIVSAGLFAGKTLTREIGSGWRRGGIEYAFSISPLFFQLRPQSLHGIAFEPVILRWNSNNVLGRAVPYVQLSGGAVRTNINLPAGDTSNFNFSAKGGGGIYLPAAGSNAFDVGVFWSHISNANLGVQNPEFNGIEVRVAYHWFR
jgi:lipid A 3-O-deacylase